jgi:muramoyltetrapeptide carboxypeptidase
MSLITPPLLNSGDIIGLVCTARKITTAELAPALDVIKGWGFVPSLGKTINAVDNQYGGSDEVRTADLQTMLDAPDIKAIFIARGGYGTVRIIDQLNWDKFRQNPKWIVGYSDVTVLHSHVTSNLGIETLHAAMPLNYATNTVEALGSIRRALTGGPLFYEWPKHALNKTGNGKGQLTGGNLSLLYSLSGSVSDIDTAGKILFIEDLDEYLYHIDRMMMQLKRSGKLSNLAGLVVGGFSDIKDNPVPFGKTAEEIILENTQEYKYPVAFGFPAGHINDNRALIIGRDVELSVTPIGNKLSF